METHWAFLCTSWILWNLLPLDDGNPRVFMDKPPEIYRSFALWIIQQIIVYNGDYGRNGYYLKTVYECDNFIY